MFAKKIFKDHFYPIFLDWIKRHHLSVCSFDL